MNKVRVLQIVKEGNFGAAQSNIFSILRRYDRNRYEVYVASEGSSRFEKEVRKLDVNFIPISLSNILRSKYLKELMAIQERENFDIIHSHSVTAGYYGRLLKKHIPSVKTVHTMHGIPYLHSDNFFSRTATKSVEQYLAQFTDRMIFETQYDLKKAVLNKLANSSKSIVINSAIDIGRYANKKKNIELLKSLGLNETHFVIGNVSSFEEQKNQKLIIQAAYYLKKKYPDMRFVLAGSGKMLRQLQDYARESHLDDIIIFAGNADDLSEYYSVFDIFILPALWEGMSYVLLEAMASRLPIICSDIPANREVIKHNYSALTIDPDDVDDLFRKIQNLYLNPDLRNMLAQNAMIDSTQYDEFEAVAKIENVYQEIMD